MSELQRTNVDGTLENLAAEINAEHRACDAALRNGLAHAVKAGQLLVEAKTHTKHGEWGGWLADNFEGSVRTAQAYMRVARELPTLEGEGGSFAGADTQRVAHLSFRGALQALSSSASLGEDDDENAVRAELLDLRERLQVADTLPEIVEIARRNEEIRAAKCEECIRYEREGGKMLLELDQWEDKKLAAAALREAVRDLRPLPNLAAWRALASIPDDLFEREVAKLRARPWVDQALTEAAMLKYAGKLAA